MFTLSGEHQVTANGTTYQMGDLGSQVCAALISHTAPSARAVGAHCHLAVAPLPLHVTLGGGSSRLDTASRRPCFTHHPGAAPKSPRPCAVCCSLAKARGSAVFPRPSVPASCTLRWAGGHFLKVGIVARRGAPWPAAMTRGRADPWRGQY